MMNKRTANSAQDTHIPRSANAFVCLAVHCIVEFLRRFFLSFFYSTVTVKAANAATAANNGIPRKKASMCFFGS